MKGNRVRVLCALLVALTTAACGGGIVSAPAPTPGPSPTPSLYVEVIQRGAVSPVLLQAASEAAHYSLTSLSTADVLAGMVPDATARRLTRGADIWDSGPTFAPDGTRIAFVRQTRTAGTWGPGEIWVMTLR